MPVNSDFQGRVYPPTETYRVSAAKIREFAEAVGSADPVHVDAEVARARGYADVIAPPTFAVLIAQQCDGQLIRDPEAGTLHVDTVREAGGHAMVTTRTELATEAGEAVCTATSTIVIRGGE